MISIDMIKGLYIRNNQVKKLIKDIIIYINSGNIDHADIANYIDDNFIIDDKKIALDLSRVAKRLKDTNEDRHRRAIKIMEDYRAIQGVIGRLQEIVLSTMNDNDIIEDKHTKLIWEDKKVLTCIDDDYNTVRDRKKPASRGK